MKAFKDSCDARAPQAGLILLFDGEVAVRTGRPDEHNPTGILTWGLNLTPAFPVPQGDNSGSWEFVTRYSGVTVPDSHGVP